MIGRPNVGKSSLVNRLLREERMIGSELPGTTRDAVDALLMWPRRRFRIVDTAGIRRPGRVARSGQIESVSVLLARRAMESADVAVLVVDATQGVTDQDAAIAGEAENAGCGIIVAANKWDLMNEDEYVRESLLEPTRRITSGFQPLMPSYRGQLREDEILALIAYIKSLTPAAGESQ